MCVCGRGCGNACIIASAFVCVYAGVRAGLVRVSASVCMYVTSLTSWVETDIEVALARWVWVGI
jgi:hypothetical protein